MSNNGTLRSGDLKPGHGYSVGLFPSGGTFGVSKVTSGVSASLSGDLTYAFAAGVNVNVRMKMAGGTTLSVWVWNQGTTMPTTPTWTATDAAPLTGTFKPLLSASNASSATPTPAGFDDFAYAVSAATQGWFIHNGTIWVHYVANLNNGTAFVAMPASEVS